jgi:hypothetical protein
VTGSITRELIRSKIKGRTGSVPVLRGTILTTDNCQQETGWNSFYGGSKIPVFLLAVSR